MSDNNKSNESSNRKTFIILDCDGCSDDAWALMLLLKAHDEKKLSLLAVTISGKYDVYSMWRAAYNIYRILIACDHVEIPIYVGAQDPLLHSEFFRNKPRYYGREDLGDLVQDENVMLEAVSVREKPPMYGRDGFADLIPEDEKMSFKEMTQKEIIQPRHAVDGINLLCKKHPKDVTIISTGRLTNIALFYATFDYFLLVKEIFIVGGNYEREKDYGFPTDDVSIKAEALYNFVADPDAAQIVLTKSYCPITVLPWEPCWPEKFPLSLEWRLKEFGLKVAQNPAIKILNEIETKQYEAVQATVWNPCAALLVAAYLFNSQFIRKKSYWDAWVNYGLHVRGEISLNNFQGPNRKYKRIRMIEELDPEFFKQVVEWYGGLANLNVTIKAVGP